MKLSTLLQIIGSGSMLMVAGIGLLLMGTAYGFSTATSVPLWVSLGGLGLFATIVGFILVDRGSEEAEEEAKRMPLLDVLRSPFLVLGTAVVGGILLARLTRSRKQVVVDEPVRDRAEAEASVPTAQPSQPAATKADGSNLSRYVGDQLRELGSVAGDMAISTAIQALGIPSMKKFLEEILGSDGTESADGPAPDSASAASSGSSQPKRPFSMQHSLNGENRPNEYDPTTS